MTITGWLFGSYKTYMYTIPVEVRDEGRIRRGSSRRGDLLQHTSTKNFPRSLSTRVRMAVPRPVRGWINHKGSGIAAVTYDYSSMSVRTNQSSKGSLSLYDGSGKNNIFFSTAPNYFTIQKIAVTSQNLRSLVRRAALRTGRHQHVHQV
ncbi:MAG: hypothetical protein ACLUQ6_06045 [Alistipes onderdonkii]